MPNYLLFGDVVESDVLLDAVRTDAEATRRVRLGDARPQADLDGRVLGAVSLPLVRYTIVETDGGVTVRFPSMFDFVILGRDTTIYPAPGASMDFAGVLIPGQLMAVILIREGHCILHASAVEVEGSGLAFVGHPGAGKSTLAALLWSQGAQPITDDVLLVKFESDGFYCVPSGSGLRLREAAASLADCLPGEITVSADARRVVTTTLRADTIPLTCIVFPRAIKEDVPVVIERLSPIESLKKLTRYPRVLGWQAPEIIAQMFRQNAELTRKIPSYSATLPWGPPFPETVHRELMALVTR